MKTNLANFPLLNWPKANYSIRLLTGTKLAVLNDIYAVPLNLFAESTLLISEHAESDGQCLIIYLRKNNLLFDFIEVLDLTGLPADTQRQLSSW
jgi:hypothetical protein